METSDLKKINIKNIQVIFWVLFFAQIVFFVIASIIVKTNNIEVSQISLDIFVFLAPVIAFLSIAAGLILNFFSARKLRKLSDPREKLQKFLSVNIIGWACLEGAVYICILGFLITGLIDFQIFAIALMLFFLFTIPTHRRVVFALKLSKEEFEMLTGVE